MIGHVSFPSSEDAFVGVAISQLFLRPTYLGDRGDLSEEVLRSRLVDFSKAVWGDRSNPVVLMGEGNIFPPLALFVELVGEEDTVSVAHLVFLTHPENGVEDGVSRLVQRHVDWSSRLRWGDVAVNVP